jgi:hypothetical protein
MSFFPRFPSIIRFSMQFHSFCFLTIPNGLTLIRIYTRSLPYIVHVRFVEIAQHLSAKSVNPNAVHLFKRNPEKIHRDSLCLNSNPNAINLLVKNHQFINWRFLSSNPNAIHILEQNPDKIDWRWLSSNPNAIHLLEQNPDKIDWRNLSLNPDAIHLLEQNPDNIDWAMLLANPNAIQLLEKYPEKIHWCYLSGNENAVHMMEQNPEKIDWSYLTENLNVMHLLINFPKEIMGICEYHTHWYHYFYQNPSIFKKEINYNFLKERMDVIREELIMKCMHPRRLDKWVELGGNIDDF